MRLAEPGLIHRPLPGAARDETEAVPDGVVAAEYVARPVVDDVVHALEVGHCDAGLVRIHDNVGPHRREQDPVDLLVDERVGDAGALFDAAPRRAWQCACQAKLLLGDSSKPNGVANRYIRKEARRTLLATAARLLICGDAIKEWRIDREEVWETANNTVAELEDTSIEEAKEKIERGVAKAERTALTALSNWTIVPNPIDLLESASTLEREVGTHENWLNPAIDARKQEVRRLIGEGAAKLPHAGLYRPENIRRWLEASGETAKEAGEHAGPLARRAFDTTLKSVEESGPGTERDQKLYGAEKILDTISPDPARKARLQEANGELDEAIALYEEAGQKDEVQRLLRTQTKWTQALKRATGQPHADLQWLVALEKLIKDRPNGHDDRLQQEEKARVAMLGEALQSHRKPAGRSSRQRG